MRCRRVRFSLFLPLCPSPTHFHQLHPLLVLPLRVSLSFQVAPPLLAIERLSLPHVSRLYLALTSVSVLSLAFSEGTSLPSRMSCVYMFSPFSYWRRCVFLCVRHPSPTSVFVCPYVVSLVRGSLADGRFFSFPLEQQRHAFLTLSASRHPLARSLVRSPFRFSNGVPPSTFPGPPPVIGAPSGCSTLFSDSHQPYLDAALPERGCAAPYPRRSTTGGTCVRSTSIDLF